MNMPKVVWLLYTEKANRHLEDIERIYRADKYMVFVYRNKEATDVNRPQRFADEDEQRMQIHLRPVREDIIELQSK